jgi:two-component system, OmpR family, sensor histidine kinase KdpD
VVANLVENAVKYTPPETPIHLSASQVDGAVELRVDDEGPGIPPQEVDRIFEKFVRGSSTRASKAGTGLGLAICRGIVEAHGGRIWAENRPDGGARLVVRLPLALETAKRSG